MVATHIPAWQRLGLKLKNQSLQPASAAPISPTNTPYAANTFRKRKVDSDDDTVINSFDSSKRFKHNAGSASDSPTSSRAGSESLSFSDPRRKSVTFSSDTKTDDGSSSKRLVQAAYAARLAQIEDGTVSSVGKLRNGSIAKTADQKQAPASKLTRMENGVTNDMTDVQQTSLSDMPANGATDRTDDSADAASLASMERKKSAQQKSPKKPNNQPSSKAQLAKQKKKQDMAIRYLEEYATARQSWKFNKSRQVAILNMALDVDELPTSYDNALVSYLKGLQGTASRQRLRDRAREILEAKGDTGDEPSLDDALPQRVKLVLEALGPNDQEMSIDDSKSKRLTGENMAAASVKNALSEARPIIANGHTMNPEAKHSTISNEATNGTTKKRGRRNRIKKKRNVAVASDSSSSSDSDSDTESDSEASKA